jgi:hypothetical protein
MDGMAVIAGNPFNFVPGYVPEGQVFLFTMAFKAFGRFGFGIGEFFAENEDAHAPLAAFLHMGRSRAVAGLAPFPAGGAAGNALFGVSGDHVGLEVILVAALADFYSHGSIAPLRFPGT